MTNFILILYKNQQTIILVIHRHTIINTLVQMPRPLPRRQRKMQPSKTSSSCCSDRQSAWKYYAPYPAYSYVLISSTCITTFCQVFRREYPALVAFVLLLSLCLFGLLYGVLVFHGLLKHEKSWRKDLPKYAIWMFYTAIMFGLVSEFLPFFGLVPALILYVISATGSAFLFYVYTAKDDCGDNSCKNCSTCDVEGVNDDNKNVKHLDSFSEMV